MAHISRSIGRRRKIKMGGNICRRNVFAGKKSGAGVGKTKRGKGTKIMAAVDSKGILLGIKLAPATPHEAKIIEATLDTIRALRLGAGRPRKRFHRLIYDKAADSLKLRVRLLKERGINLICPHRSNCKNHVQDGRKLRRYSRRWIIERANAWLQNYRRIVVRYDRLLSSYAAFVTIACCMICVKRL